MLRAKPIYTALSIHKERSSCTYSASVQCTFSHLPTLPATLSSVGRNLWCVIYTTFTWPYLSAVSCWRIQLVCGLSSLFAKMKRFEHFRCTIPVAVDVFLWGFVKGVEYQSYWTRNRMI